MTMSCDDLSGMVSGASEQNGRETFKATLLQTYFYNLHPKLSFKRKNRMPSIGRSLYFLHILLSADLSIWAMQEAVPLYIVSPENQYVMKAFIAG